MTAKNDITGDTIATKSASELYRQGWDRIFGKKDQQPENKDLDNKKDESAQSSKHSN